jgi:hypothetical protein
MGMSAVWRRIPSRRATAIGRIEGRQMRGQLIVDRTCISFQGMRIFNQRKFYHRIEKNYEGILNDTNLQWGRKREGNGK